MTTIQLIKKHKINRAYLANRLGLKPDIFNKKVSDNMKLWHLREDELEELKKVFLEMAKDLEAFGGKR